MANAANFLEAFRGSFVAGGDIHNRDYSHVNGWNNPK
jgi:hypothetical protein